jgi:hypothetical protein
LRYLIGSNDYPGEVDERDSALRKATLAAIKTDSATRSPAENTRPIAFRPLYPAVALGFIEQSIDD